MMKGAKDFYRLMGYIILFKMIRKKRREINPERFPRGIIFVYLKMTRAKKRFMILL